MPLDPQIVAILTRMGERGGTPVDEATPHIARLESYGWLDFVGDPEELSSVEHEFITTPTADIAVRVYHPIAPVADPPPALVFFHGSGWTIANIAIADAPHRMLANRTGCVVVAANYQKAPENRFPQPLDDCTAAFEWTVANADRLHVDPRRVGVGGDSAGGNLAAALCLRQLERDGSLPAFQVLVYPAVECGADYPSITENAEGYMLTARAIAWFWNNYIGSDVDPHDPYVSPMRAASLVGLPPALVLTAEYDPLRDEGEAYAKRLSHDAVDATLIRYDGQIHAFLWMGGAADIAARSMMDIGEWIRRKVLVD